MTPEDFKLVRTLHLQAMSQIAEARSEIMALLRIATELARQGHIPQEAMETFLKFQEYKDEMFEKLALNLEQLDPGIAAEFDANRLSDLNDKA